MPQPLPPPPPGALADRIAAALSSAGLRLPPFDQDAPIEQLARWLQAMLETNRRANLTAVRDPDAALAKHILEPLQGWRDLLNADVAVPHGALIDIGAGNGAPGLPIALAEPDRPAVLLDSRRAAVDFLTQMPALLNAPQLNVHNARAEVAAKGGKGDKDGKGDLRESFAVALSRAAARPPIALELALPYVAVGGVALLWTAPLDDDARAALMPTIDALGAAPIPIPDRPDLLAAVKLRPTPSRFPRRWAVLRRQRTP